MTKVNTAEIPSRAKHLFMKLYCEKKGGKTRENIHNASQSWLSLSLTKKQHFYDTVSNKTAVKKAQLIIQTEPFLRAKYPSLVRKQKQNDVCQEHQNNKESDPGHVTMADHDDTFMEFDNTSNSFLEDNVDKAQVSEVQNYQTSYMNEIDEDADSAEGDTNEKDAENIPLSESVLPIKKNKAQVNEVHNLQKSYMSVIDEDTDTADEDIEDGTNEKVTENIPLSEPILPITKTGRELFELLKTRNGTNKPYESLTAREKQFYGRAVCAIKKDYVKKYKEYLESLSPRQLFDYYMKIF